MNDKTAKYYLIKGRLLGKEEHGEYFLLKNEVWEQDVNNAILDRLMGYDPSEPSDSPYGMYDTSIMEEIEEITYEEAKAFLNN